MDGFRAQGLRLSCDIKFEVISIQMIFKARHCSHKPPFHTSIISRMARFQKTRDHKSPLSPIRPCKWASLILAVKT